MRKSKGKGRGMGRGEMVSIAVQTAVVDVLAPGELCNKNRRVAHLLGMYGFVLYVVATAVMVFAYPTGATPTPAIWPVLWWIGALMVLVGLYCFQSKPRFARRETCGSNADVVGNSWQATHKFAFKQLD